MVNSSLLKWTITSACTSPATSPAQTSPVRTAMGKGNLVRPQEGLVKNLLMIWSQYWKQFSAHLRGENETNSRDHLNLTQAQVFFIATGNRKRRQIQIKTQQYCQKDSSKIREIKQQFACCVLVPYLREILEDNECPLQVPQHPS